MLKCLLEFAYDVPYDVFAYNSRVGTSVSYWSVCKHIKDLSEEGAQTVFDVGQDPGKGSDCNGTRRIFVCSGTQRLVEKTKRKHNECQAGSHAR